MKREVCFLIGAEETVLWSDASESPLALPDSRERWEAIWSRRSELVEICHSHPLGPECFSAEDLSTMQALDDALGRRCRFSLVTPTQYLVRGLENEACAATPPGWVAALRLASGIEAPHPGPLPAPQGEGER
ncbi:MAG: Mov34/MPN/PAD-1 family protein [Archangium sp.]|nr:Mov34/MPN/PAD-1 family protein [Archangium sp.]